MHGQYEVISEIYDELSGVDNEKWAAYIDGIIKKYSPSCSIVLDAACGTGKLTSRLSDMGYDMIGLDISYEMLSIARQRCQPNVLLLNQDMCDFELYGTVGAVISCLDSVNYLNGDELKKFFSCCQLYLDPDGLLIFDANTEYKFENVYADNDFILESDNTSHLLAWSCNYSKQTKQCLFSLSLFSKNKNGTYTREDEQQTEYCHSDDFIKKTLEECGFSIIGTFGELSDTSPDTTSHRIHYVCRARHEKQQGIQQERNNE